MNMPNNNQTTGESPSCDAACSPVFSDTPETNRVDDNMATKSPDEATDYRMMFRHAKKLERERMMLRHARKLERERDAAIAEATNAVNDSIRVAWERNRYKTALEGIAGFPHQYFDAETPCRMRKLAEHAISLENSSLSNTAKHNQ